MEPPIRVKQRIWHELTSKIYFNVFSLFCVEYLFSFLSLKNVWIKFPDTMSHYIFFSPQLSTNESFHCRKIHGKPLNDSLDTYFFSMSLLTFGGVDDSIFLKNRKPRGNSGYFPCICVCFVDFRLLGEKSPSRIKCALRTKGNFRSSEKIILQSSSVLRSFKLFLCSRSVFHSHIESVPDSSSRLFTS